MTVEMNRRVRALTLVAVTAIGASCASSNSGQAARPRVRPPELLTRSRPDLVPVNVPVNSSRPSLVVDIEVTVKPDGSADMSTLKLTGPGAAANRASVTAWLEGARFKPGTQDGIPVAAMFHYPITATVRAVRVR